MTVNYMREAATVHVGTFLKLLFRWRGSVWKIIWKELNIYLFIYFNICVGYQFLIKGSDFGPAFERLSRYCRTLMRDASTVLTFALGFYVSQIADRWWKVFMTIPWPDTFGLQTCAFLRSRTSEEGSKTDRMIRKTAMRYVILTYVLVFRDISERIRRRFPTYDHLPDGTSKDRYFQLNSPVQMGKEELTEDELETNRTIRDAIGRRHPSSVVRWGFAARFTAPAMVQVHHGQRD
ncbi:unnamed protein product, partial [Nippostrongylus brasiliensis]|uniref:Bestrophin homolog n=1 Tax=Nippostrongylus brasiliensis TaxID=27835 RepID=A0A0N4Y0Y6_NIPBR